MIKIVYACDDGYIDCLFLSLISILRRTKETIHFFLLSQDFTTINPKFKCVSSRTLKILDELVTSYNKLNKLTFIETNRLYAKYLKGNKNETSVCSPYTNLRLLLDKIDISGKVLYLDTDIMANGNINELYQINLKHYCFAANKDWLGRFWIPRKDYFNSGVLLIDLENARKNNLFEISRFYLFKRKYKLADQTALYKAGRKTKSFFIFPDGFKYNTQKGMNKETLLKHFCAGWVHPYGWQNIKQNNIEKVHSLLKIYDFDDDYEEFKKWKKLF